MTPRQDNSNMAFFNRVPNSLLQRRSLTKLYSDTKQSYESAKVLPGADPHTVAEDPEVLQLRGDLQIQQDRLLAWGMHWADVGANSSGTGDSKGKKGAYGEEVEIDQKIDQAGLGDLVASVMEEIKRLLDESGRLQHPEKYDVGKTRVTAGKDYARAPSSPKISERKEWKTYEVKTGRVLLERLTNCIDMLYSLIDGQKEQQQSPVPPRQARGSPMTDGDRFRNEKGSSLADLRTSAGSSPTDIYSHPLYIDFARLQPMHDPSADTDMPPSYEDVQNAYGYKTRSVYLYSAKQSYVIVDLVGAHSVPSELHKDSPLQQIHSLAEQLSGRGLLSWDGHLRVLGFTLTGAEQSHSTKFGLVYALPALSELTALPQFQNLNTAISVGAEQTSSTPPLEDKFRLAYNIALLAAGYLSHNTTHGYVKPTNIVFLQENEDQRQLGSALRKPYLLQPIKRIVGMSSIDDSLNESMYHHADADEIGYGTLAAHDVYSVGLLLFEIGCWMPLKKFYKPKYYNDKALFLDRLQRLYLPKLRGKCGSRYVKAVQKCLDAPAQLADKPHTTDAAKYLLDVVSDLMHCCAIDEAEPPSGLDVEVFEALIDEHRRSTPISDLEQKQKNLVTGVQIQATENVYELPVRHTRARDSKLATTKRKSSKNAASGGLRKFPDMPVPQDRLTVWNTMLMPRLQKILTDALRDSPEAASCSLMMVGPSPDKATTTIVVQCADTRRVHDELRSRFKCKRGWGLVVCKGEIRRSGRRLSGTMRARRSKFDRHEVKEEPQPTRMTQREYQKRPSHGASIGAFKDNEHLPPVSFGGTLLVDGTPFGMSVHHMLDEGEDADLSDEGSDDELEPDMKMSAGPPRSSAGRQQLNSAMEAMGTHMGADTIMSMDSLVISDSDDLELDDVSDTESDTSTIRPDFQAFDDDGNEFWFLEDSSEPDLDSDHGSDDSHGGDEDDTASVGDKPGLMPYDLMDDEDLYVTQPALDDVDEDFFPSMEDRDDDHLESHKFGTVHASSGIRRVVRDGMKHEIDWALISIDTDRRPFELKSQERKDSNRPRQAGRQATRSRPALVGIAPMSSLPNAQVASCGRTSGYANGRISQAMGLIKFQGRTSFSSSLTVEGGFGVAGDSGAWIWNSETNELCGHVLAWADGAKVAFMAPMEVLVDDIKRCLGATEVVLPSQLTNSQMTPKGKATANDHARAHDALQMQDVGAGLSHEEVARMNRAHDQYQRARNLQDALKRMGLEQRPLPPLPAESGQLAGISIGVGGDS